MSLVADLAQVAMQDATVNKALQGQRLFATSDYDTMLAIIVTLAKEKRELQEALMNRPSDYDIKESKERSQ